MKAFFKKIQLSVIDALFPPQCVGCKREGSLLCTQCQDQVRYHKNQSCPVCSCSAEFGVICYRCSDDMALDGLLVTAPYEDPIIEQSIKLCKYRYAEDLAVSLGDMMWKAHYPYFETFATRFVPVPLHWRRKAQRGFNVTEILARRMSKKRQHSYFDCLQRTRSTDSQATLNESERKKNVANAFDVKVSCIPGGVYCVVDDVASTLSTLNECAKVLKKNGASYVWGAVLARGTKS